MSDEKQLHVWSIDEGAQFDITTGTTADTFLNSFADKQEALDWAEEWALAKNDGWTVVVHGTDGDVEDTLLAP